MNTQPQWHVVGDPSQRGHGQARGRLGQLVECRNFPSNPLTKVKRLKSPLAHPLTEGRKGKLTPPEFAVS